ncbi:MAG: zinc metallopeptidase [Lachnospiraceae bacterium]
MLFGNAYNYYFDPTIILLLIGLAITLIASARLKATFAKYRKVQSRSGLTGAQTAEKVLHSAGIYDVQIVSVQGSLTDHYDPRTRRVCLSDDVYSKTSLAAEAVAAHECGHAIQHNENYAPLNIRSAIVPVCNIGSSLAWPIFFIGLLTSIQALLWLGVIFFSAAVVFQLVTLPVEFNASSRALKRLVTTGIVTEQENKGARKVLTAAALTYVAALAASVLQLLRLLLIAGGRNRD